MSFLDLGPIELPELSPFLRAEVVRLFAALDDALRSLGVACWARGDCCDFEHREHRLYASSIEIAFARERHPAPLPRRGALCPFWRDRRCTERERRPLGCRTYFCDRRYRDVLQEIHEAYHRELRALAVRSGLSWSYRPFVESIVDARFGGPPAEALRDGGS